MRAARCESYGGPDVVTVTEVDAPALSSDAVRVRVAAAAINFPDVLVVANSYQVSAPLPFVPGSEFAGEVTEVGSEVDTLSVGQRVFGSVFVGAFAEEIVVAPSALTPVPQGVALESAAAFGVAYRTAYHALRSVAEIHAGDEVIVLGAGGGVGLAAVQIGAVLGASVTAVASSQEKLEAARAAGAGRLINYRTCDLRQQLREQLPSGATAVVDPVGGDVSEPALRALAPGGRFVTVGYASGTIPRIPLNLVLLKDVVLRGFEFFSFTTRHPEAARRDEAELMDLFAAGKVAPQVHATFDLADTAAALALVAGGRAIGKVVITVGRS
jgi:NADPH2:quinone reductase